MVDIMTDRYKQVKLYKTFGYSYTIPYSYFFFAIKVFAARSKKPLILNDLFRHIKYRVARLSFKITQFYASFSISDFLKAKNNDIYED
jgi:hypothetical protein